MTLEQIKDTFKSTCLSHKSIKSFDYGEDSLIATGKATKYPFTFLEIPYNSDYDMTNNKFKTFQFALCIMIGNSFDNVKTDHERISKAETIGDAIITKIQKGQNDFRFNRVNGISLRQFSSDNASGFRYDITITTGRECYNSDDFNA